MLFIRYFIHIYKQQKKLFYFFGLAFSLYILTFILQLFDISYIQVNPFQGYGMYSERHASKTEYTYIEIELNDSIYINLWEKTQVNRMMILSPVKHFYSISEFDGVDPRQTYIQSKLNFISPEISHALDYCTIQLEQKEELILWYKRYLKEVFGFQINSFRFIEKTIDQNYSVLRQKTILHG
jgi:hypothetical protein